MRYLILLSLLLIFDRYVYADCVPTGPSQGDEQYQPQIASPTFPLGTGPRIVVDEAHFNYETINPTSFVSVGLYYAFKTLAEADGYRLSTNSQTFSSSSLSNVDVLVIGGASFITPIDPATRQWNQGAQMNAFSSAELDALVSFVSQGGALIIADNHAPVAGSNAALLSRFGIETKYGAVLTTKARVNLANHPIIKGRNPSETVKSFYSGGGASILLSTDRGVLTKYAEPTIFGALDANKCAFLFQPPSCVPSIAPAQSNVNSVAFNFGKTRSSSGGKVLIISHGGDLAQKYESGCRSSNPLVYDQYDNDLFVLNALRWIAAK